MTIRKKQPKRGPEIIDLTGPDGNAWFLLARANQYGKQLDLDVKKINDEMIAGDYENLLEVFDRYFGEFVILER